MPGVVAQLPGGRSSHFGVEVQTALMWKGWEPGQEYTKNITLKNVRVKTQKLKYKVPGSRFFTTLYPQPVVLSAGTSFTLPVTFRPLEKVVYDDKVEFHTSEGLFEVPIRAVLPEVNIEVPEQINFNMCAAQDLVQTTFDIRNASELVTPFQIECHEPFYIEPSDGVLEPLSTITVTTTFRPKAALVYETDAMVKYGNNFTHSRVTRLEGVGKYPHLLVTSNSSSSSSSKTPAHGAVGAVINFGEVSVSQTVEKWVELHNLSPVNAPFKIEQVLLGASRIDKVFQCPQREGVVPAHSTIRIPLSYTPSTVGSKSIDYFHIQAIGNISKTEVTCIGSSKGPKVVLSKGLINFMQIMAGETATKTIDIHNDSNTDATFQFQIDCSESVFKFECESGTLPANSKKTIILQFQPVHSINYYRRITCLVHNQEPLFVDLLGTCHTETVKPAVLQAKHINRYRLHVDRGLSFTAPEELNQLRMDGQLMLDEEGALYSPKEGTEGPPQGPAPLPAMDTFFNDGYYSDITHTPHHVSLDIHRADFGGCKDTNNIEQQTVNVTNHTKGKISVVWMGDPGHVFSVTPATLDIPPLKSCSFRITFRPNATNQFFGAELECYAYYKSQRDYRLVEDSTHMPPWCMTLVASGHTFMPNYETFLPRCHLDSARLIFPAVNAGEAAYRTLLLNNTGPTPILFDFEKDTTGIYSMKPTKGMLQPAGKQLFVVKVVPAEVKTYNNTLKLRMNEADKNTLEISVCGSAEAAEVQLENTAEMFLKPTCVGTASQRQYSIRNVSRMPLLFEWKMKNADQTLLEVEPSSGVIQPNEEQSHTWTFKPRAQEKYVMKPAVILWGQGQSSATSGGKKRQFVVRAIGEGTVGEITSEQSYIDFGTVVVGNRTSQQLTVYNNSDCTLRYQLLVDQHISGPYPEETTQYDPIALYLETVSGDLPARSRKTITATVRPMRRVYYQWTVSYQLIPSEGQELDESIAKAKSLCHVLAVGVFPTMAITDARCYGSASGISKKQLWNLFSLDTLNTYLESDPCVEELVYSATTRQSHRRRPPVYTRAIQDFNFGAAPLGSEACVVQLMFENTGAVPCEWAFMFPSDLQLELDYWAETAEFDDDEMHEMKVMDNKLFTVEPRTGQLKQGETQTVTLTYTHSMAGTDRLPVLLKLSRGREILYGKGKEFWLNFIGVTVDPTRRYIHFASNKFMFSPVSIGESNSPVQIYEMYNGGALPVKYEFDCAPLTMVRHENFDHPIFECLNPMGEVLPGQTANIQWRFSPLEAKTYMVDIPIQIHNGDTALVTFTGVGYDKRAMGDTMRVTDNHDSTGVPSMQSVPMPGQLCYLSQERMSFGNVPLFTRTRRVVALTNRSDEHAVAFKWHVTSQKDAKILSISPREGKLDPGQSTVCRITFTSFGAPSFYDLDLICEVTNMTEYTEYRQQLRAWEEEQQRQRVEFCITEMNPEADIMTASGLERPASSRLSALSGSRTPSPETDLTKYKTLPPIKNCSVDDVTTKTSQQSKMNEKYWARPELPRTFLLHLGVTSRTHDVTQFQLNFTDEYKNYYIDRLLSESSTSAPARIEPLGAAEGIVCTESECDVIANAMTNIIRGLLDDTQFQESCQKVIHEPIPYFQQFNTEREECVSSSPSSVEIRVEMMSSKDGQLGGSSRGELLEQPSSEGRQSGSRQASASSSSSRVSVRDASRGSSQVMRVPSEGRPEVYSPTPPTTTPLSPPQSSARSTTMEGALSTARTTDGSVLLPEDGGDDEDQRFSQKEYLKKLPEFGNAAELLLENTLMNVIQEAFQQEFNITSRPRLVALPPRPSTPMTSHSNQR